jgi:hypothetical protein
MNRDLLIYEYVKKEDYNIVAGPDWPSYEEFKTHQNIQEFVYDEIDTMLWNLRPFDNPSFCVLPFYGVEYPANIVCCRLSHPYDLESIKSDMLAGRRSPYCQDCWTTEDAGLKSDRIVKNETLDFYSDTDIQKLVSQCELGENSTIHYKIDTNNVCNATCITCTSSASSAWAQLERKNGVIPSKTWFLKENDLPGEINYATAKSIGFRGGEPLLSDTNFEILEKLLEKNNTDCFINFTTNGSITPSAGQKKLISKFKNVNFGFSLDGVGPVFEYLRYPLEWSKILENIDYCRNNNILISVHHTISNLNVYYYNQSASWFNDNNINFVCNFVEDPSWFRPTALPKQVKNTIVNKQISPEMNFLLKTHTDKDESDYELFKTEMAKQDSWKGIRMQDYLPEFLRLLDEKAR